MHRHINPTGLPGPMCGDDVWLDPWVTLPPELVIHSNSVGGDINVVCDVAHDVIVTGNQKQLPDGIIELLARRLFDGEPRGNPPNERFWAETATQNEFLSKLAQRDDKYVRSRVAMNKASRPDVLRKLAQDRYVLVRRDVASNLNTPIDALEILTRDASKQVRKNALKTLQCITKTKNKNPRRIRKNALIIIQHAIQHAKAKFL